MADVVTITGACLSYIAAIYGLGYGVGSAWAYFRTAVDLD